MLFDLEIEETDESTDAVQIEVEISLDPDIQLGDIDLEYRPDLVPPYPGDIRWDETPSCPFPWPDNCDTQRAVSEADSAWVRAATMNGLRELEYAPLELECQGVEVILAFQGCYHFWLVIDAGNFSIDGEETELWAHATLNHGEEILATLSPNPVVLERTTDSEDIYQSQMETVIFEHCGSLDEFNWPNRIMGCPATLTITLQNGEHEDAPGPLDEPLVDTLTVVPVWVSQ